MKNKELINDKKMRDKLSKVIQHILQEAQFTNAKQLAEQFMQEVLSKYKYKVSGEGHIDCKWATKTFYNWALEQGVSDNQLQVIFFVWPEKDVVAPLKHKGILGKHYPDEGASHIAPIYKDQVLDFTIGQFTGNDNDLYRITPLDLVLTNKSVYSKYGYGTNKLNGEHYIVGKYKDVVKKAEIKEPDMFAPPLKNAK